jgi:TolB protein
LPDGKGFVMMHRESGMFGIAKQLFVGNQLSLLAPLGRDESPSIAPNGQMVVYASNRGGRGILAMMSIDGGVRLNLPARDGSVQEPAWSPFN